MEPLSASEVRMSHGSSSDSELEEGETASVEGPEMPPRSSSLENEGGDEENGLEDKRDSNKAKKNRERRSSQRDTREASPARRKSSGDFSGDG